MSKVKMPALPLPDAAMFAPRVAEYGRQCAEAMREACAKAALHALGYKHLASENGEIYAAQNHALSRAAAAIRALEIEQP